MWILVLLAALPEIADANGALLQLGLPAPKRLEALDNLAKACAGRARRALVDDPRILARLAALSKEPDAELKKKLMDAHRCASPAKLVPLLEGWLADEDPKIVAYAAEVSARVADPRVVPALLDALERAQPGCEGKLEPAALDRCVWLHYAPGASLAGGERALRERAGSLAVKGLRSIHAKIRELSVETLAATALKRYAAEVATLIAAEKKGAFDPPNAPALISRFTERERALRSGE